MPIFGLPSIFEDGYKTLHDAPQQALGSCYILNTDDIELSYVRFSEDVKEGDCVRTKFDHYTNTDMSPETSGGTDFPVAGSQKISENDATYLTSLAGIPDEPTRRDYAKIAITGGTGDGQRGYITHYTNKVLNIRWYDTDDGTLETALDATSDYAIWAPWYMERAFADAASATKGVVNGIVLSDAQKDQYGLIGVVGDFPVNVDEAVTAGDFLIPDVTANQGQGVKLSAADIVPPYAVVNHTSAVDKLAEATVFCKRISVVREIAESLIRGTPRPDAT